MPETPDSRAIRDQTLAMQEMHAEVIQRMNQLVDCQYLALAHYEWWANHMYGGESCKCEHVLPYDSIPVDMGD